MQIHLGPFDFGIIIVYLAGMIGIGLALRRRAAASEEDYFLGGRRLPWWMLSMSGSVSMFDMTGTMWIVSVFAIIGVRSMWHHWMWGFLMGAFMMSYTGKWVRRSRVITGAQWMATRFGTDRGGDLARLAATILAITTGIVFIGYAFQGVGKFAYTYLGWSPHVAATVIMAVTALYVVLGGVYGVVFTEVLQAIILTIASLIIAAKAFVETSAESILEKAPSGWDSFLPAWKIDYLEGVEGGMFYLFGPLVIIWVMKGLVLNAGGPAQLYDFQRFLSARSARDAAKTGALWSVFQVVRWAVTMGIAALALVHLESSLDSEQVLPVVIGRFFGPGLRGFIVAGFLAAFMATFESTVNVSASYIVEDVYRRYIDPSPPRRRVIGASYAASIAVVAVGIAIGWCVTTIWEIWNWMMMCFGAGAIFPNFLRWYWWRMNGWGYAVGTFVGIGLAVLQLVLFPREPLYYTFPAIALGSLAATVIATLLTAPADPEVLAGFYRNVQPGGRWGPVVRWVRKKDPGFRKDISFALELLNTALGMVAIFSLYLAPVYLMIHKVGHAAGFALVAVVAGAILYRTWYRTMPTD